MKALALLCCASAALLSLAVPAHAQAKKKGPVSKLFIAETSGETQIQSGDKIFAARQATAFAAAGTVIETKERSHNAFVYSNGTGMYVDQSTRVEVDRFVQEPFQSDRAGHEVEPSISQSDVFVARGMVGICTSRLVSGSAMTYSTPQAAVNIRGRKVAIETNPRETIVYLLEGDVTVRSSNTQERDSRVLRPGEQAVIRAGSPGRPPSITVGPIDQKMMQTLDDRVAIACNAKKTVSFEMIERKSEEGVVNRAGEDPSPTASAESAPAGAAADTTAAPAAAPAGSSSFAAPPDTSAGGDTTQEIVARPTSPTNLPTNIVVSPASLIPPGK